MSEIILPCPFCGAPGVIEEGEDPETANMIYHGMCGDKYGEYGCQTHPQGHWKSDRWEAVKDWNRRGPPREPSNDGHEAYEEDMK
jgi:hypothetical protein